MLAWGGVPPRWQSPTKLHPNYIEGNYKLPRRPYTLKALFKLRALLSADHIYIQAVFGV
jgi:hypothetical protein